MIFKELVRNLILDQKSDDFDKPSILDKVIGLLQINVYSFNIHRKETLS